MLSYIVTNKWLRSGYGEPLRNFFANQGVFEQIIDFGHAPIFQDADTFPCILSVRKPSLSVEVVGGALALRPLPATLQSAKLEPQINDYAPAIQTRKAEALKLEHRLSDFVNQAYGLTPEEIDLMWKTAPLRMPIYYVN